jgi:hypothetical protein
MFRTFDVIMDDSRRNSSSGIIIFFLMFIFFSFVHEEKERQITKTTAHSSDISGPNNSCLAIFGQATSVPGINFFQTSILNAKFTCLNCISGREFVVNNLVSTSLNSGQFKFHFRKPMISLFFLQKVPEQGKEDDLLSIA